MQGMRFICTGGWIDSLAFLQDGQLLATGSLDETAYVWGIKED